MFDDLNMENCVNRTRNDQNPECNYFSVGVSDVKMIPFNSSGIYR